MRLYKLTDEHDQTYGGTRWGEHVTHTAPGGGELCGAGWIHAYTDPLLAALLNPIHADFPFPHLWRASRGNSGLQIGVSDGLKIGVTSLTTIRRQEMPAVTVEQRVRFGILCALEVYSKPDFREWAEAWLNGSDRSQAAAEAAEEAAKEAAEEATEEAAWAEEAAAEAAEAAARAATGAARTAARAAARAAEEAAKEAADIDFASLAHLAFDEEKNVGR